MKHIAITIPTILAALAASLLAASASDANMDAPAILPLPQKMELREGAFRLSPDTRIFANSGSLATAGQLAARLRPATGYPLNAGTKWFAGAPIAKAILLTTKGAAPELGAEGYNLIVATNFVVIRARTQAGLFYGAQTLLQLLPPGIFSTNVAAQAVWKIPCVQIQDWPRFQWRGLMLDVSRHFYTKAEVEKILDSMALHKLNTFHWHLVDMDGWRIQIKKYPRLTEVGAWRNEIGFGLDPKSSTAYGPDGRYGGFYTQDDIREVVAYAAALHITIIPEIEMPGHSTEVMACYPELSCTGETYSIDRGAHNDYHMGVFCAGNEASYTFLESVLDEVFELFPARYVHIGGDEVDKRDWKNCPKCQALMKSEGLKNEEELQSYFIRRIEKYVNAHGKTLIGWSEIMKGGLAQNAVVMDWIGGAREAATAGHDVVMSPTKYCYLDHYQSTNHEAEPRAIGGYLPLKNVYAFEPIPTNLPAQFQTHILGAQGNLWTEYVASPSHAEYMIFPRLCALAEVTWSAKNARDWDGFQPRLVVDEQRLDELGINYRRDTFSPGQ